MNTKLLNRIENWKFRSAVNELDASVPSPIAEAVTALADMYGDVGFALDGVNGELVGAVVALITEGDYGTKKA